MALLLTGIHLSVSAAVGFIALFGIAVQNGVILLSKINLLRREGIPLHEAILQGSVSRLRPVVMTALVAMLGLLPAALSTSVGSEAVKPFAMVIIGGLHDSHAANLDHASSTLLAILKNGTKPGTYPHERDSRLYSAIHVIQGNSGVT